MSARTLGPIATVAVVASTAYAGGLGVLFPAGDVVQSLSIVLDEGPVPVILEDVFVGPEVVNRPEETWPPPCFRNREVIGER